jgi:hypothetical protein
LHFNDHIDEAGDIVFRHACKLGFEKESYRSGSARVMSPDARTGLSVRNSAERIAPPARYGGCVSTQAAVDRRSRRSTAG